MQQEMVNRLTKQFDLEAELATALLVDAQWNYGNAATRVFN
jgi:hypothetical protein